MTRTNIDIDDELVAEVIRRYDLSSKREAVDLALRRLVGPRITPDLVDRVIGVGWEGDLDEMRTAKVEEW
ncbi:type II toxin-antitoxin system VapB family antitoxin [Luteipulveratus sp. YIM 133132]|uniref:Type II toxin-antitoxin system VapB family antitoxin n=1 Tax=Luteipulveratus flavus TaxID=3031728 RepID=A0ABT6C9V0_9MICO|nr:MULTISPECIES: type II toxin-antitoxin system VapB family antitoxin [unclassified Luteipulveratus]MDE9365567.1 type II toxin-antitoxin system VapB family antitoxin [Luteipulveratus sp. YIM 133132]MDF8265684.1 type II toxin-antitoxin system VapB family antitoxin [Luteipulveratus sp. YIM 133296]